MPYVKAVALVAAILFSLTSSGQIGIIDTTIAASTAYQFELSSLEDQGNNAAPLYNSFPYNGPYWDSFCSAFIPARNLIDTLSFSNNSDSTIDGFYFFMNNNKVMNLDSLAHGLLADTNENVRVNKLFDYVSTHNLYYYKPDELIADKLNFDASKLLNIYGYGHCGMIANAVAWLASIKADTNQLIWNIHTGSHGTADVVFDNDYITIDADQQGLFLMPDNSTYGSYFDVAKDGYVYNREKLLGNAVPYKRNWQRILYNTFSDGGAYFDNTDSSNNNFYLQQPRYRGENIKFAIRPGTTILYLPNEIKNTDHFASYYPIPTMSTVRSVIGKGLLVSRVTHDLSLASTYNCNLYNEKLVSNTINDSCSIVLAAECPYVVSDGSLRFRLQNVSTNGKVTVYFGKGAIGYQPIDSFSNTAISDTILAYNLFDIIDPYNSEECFSYNIRIDWQDTSSISISDLSLVSEFQFNKLTAPSLHDGLNQVVFYSSSAGASIDMRIRYNTYNGNLPPDKPMLLAPTPNETASNNDLKFTWRQPNDFDGDSIVAYHVQVSTTPDFTVPLNGTYDRIIIGDTNFAPEITDVFDYNKNYYWRVRACDQHYLWSHWSDTGIFMGNVPSRIKNLRWLLVSDSLADVYRLSWSENSDSNVNHYYIYMTDSNSALYTEPHNLKDSCLNNQVILHKDSIKYYTRVQATNIYGGLSTASFQLAKPIPYVFNVGDIFDVKTTLYPYIEHYLQPRGSVDINYRPTFIRYSNGHATAFANQSKAVSPGMCLIELCTKVGNDTVVVLTLAAQINDTNQAFTYKPTVVVTAAIDSTTTTTNVQLSALRYAGISLSDTNAVFSIMPTQYTALNALSFPGYYPINVYGAASITHNIVYNHGLIYYDGPIPRIYDTTETTICFGSSYLFGNTTLIAPGTYIDTFSSINLIDSIVTLQLNVLQPIDTFLSVEICEGTQLQFDSQLLSASGMYQAVFASSTGCDSLVHLQLNVLEIDSFIKYSDICNGSSYLFNNVSLTNTGTYIANFLQTNGCDSTIVLVLTETPYYDDTSYLSICPGTRYILGNDTLSTTGVYSDTFSSGYGCDSLVTLFLNVLPIYDDTFNISLCAGDSLNFAGSFLASSGFYSHTFTTSYGCDSLVTINLKTYPPNIDTLHNILCSGDTISISSNLYYSGGQFVELYTNANGCDSILIIEIIQNPLPLPQIAKVQNRLSTYNYYASYQWYRNGVALPNKTDSFLNIIENGAYKVAVKDSSNCSAISSSVTITNLSIQSELQHDELVHLYPNPTTGVVKIFVSPTISCNSEIEICDVLGNIVCTYKLSANAINDISIANFVPGTYTYRVVCAQNVLKQGKLILMP
ncbi:MAG: hypothetical protein RL660_1683 [Bacteroidota bacterium]|jgi:hypothetical protein